MIYRRVFARKLGIRGDFNNLVDSIVTKAQLESRLNFIVNVFINIQNINILYR